jgi:hypothetical protein
MSITTKKPVNYLNNRDILKEIHLSKNSYCSYKNPEKDHRYDYIIDNPTEPTKKSLELALNPDVLKEAREVRAARLSVEIGQKVDPDTIPNTDLVFRVMTWDHVPLAPKQPRKSDKKKTKFKKFYRCTSFAPHHGATYSKPACHSPIPFLLTQPVVRGALHVNASATSGSMHLTLYLCLLPSRRSY